MASFARAFRLVAFATSLALPGSASAVSLQISVEGQVVGYYGDTQLGCTTEGVITACQGGGLTAGNLRLDTWSMTFDSDPSISGITAVTNLNQLASQQFTLLFTLPVAPPLLPSTLIGGSVQGGMTDNTGDDATVSTAPGSSFYAARIDGGTVQTLYSAPQAFSAGGPSLSGNVPAVAFGTPIPSQAGPAVNTSIGIQLDFVLTAGDSASFTSNFVAQQIPEPATAALLGLGLGGLALLARRRS